MANSTAPGRLEIVRSLVNTIEPDHETDLLQANGDLPRWCRETGFCPDVDETGLATLRRFREALRDVLESNSGPGDQTQHWQALQPFSDRTCYTIRIPQPGELTLEAQGSGAQAAIGAVLAIVYDAIREGTWQRLKACRKHSCRWAFYDRSKNGSGAWCSMRVCGNRAKAERRRARGKAQ